VRASSQLSPMATADAVCALSPCGPLAGEGISELQRRRMGEGALAGIASYGGDPEETPIGANLPNWILICTFSRRLAKMALNVLRGCSQCAHVRLGSDRIDERLDDHTQQTPNAVFYAASRRGESPRCSAMSGSVNSASKRWQRMCALALLGSLPGGRERPTPLLRCLKAISMRHRNR
jgi:hypothetical protein